MDKRHRPATSRKQAQWPGFPHGEDPYEVLVQCVREHALFLLDRDGRVRSWNTGAELIHGYGAGEAVGQRLDAFYTPAEAARGYPAKALQSAARLGRFEDEGWRVRKDGMRFWAHTAISALRDLTERVQQQEALRRSEQRSTALRDQAIRDPLTGVFNRRFLFSHLRETLDRAVIMTAAVLALDVDHFKQINDRFGHDAGDNVLVAFAAHVQRLSRSSDMLFRMGGDEFVLYLPGTAESEARAIGERIRAATQEATLLMNHVVTVSIGVAALRPEDSLETWVQAADARLYEAKRAGRNRVA